jgi:hypothetical protein
MEIIIIILMVIALILFKLFRIQPEVEIVTTGLIISGTCYYIALNINDQYISKIFFILSILSIFMIFVLEILLYIKKIQFRQVVR